MSFTHYASTQSTKVIQGLLLARTTRICNGAWRLAFFCVIALFPTMLLAPFLLLYQIILILLSAGIVVYLQRTRTRKLLNKGEFVPVKLFEKPVNFVDMVGEGQAPHAKVQLQLGSFVMLWIFRKLDLPPLWGAYEIFLPGGEHRWHGYVLYENEASVDLEEGKTIALIDPDYWLIPPSPFLICTEPESSLASSLRRFIKQWYEEQTISEGSEGKGVSRKLFYERIPLLGLLLYAVCIVLYLPLIIGFGEGWWLIPMLLAIIVGFPTIFGWLRFKYNWF